MELRVPGAGRAPGALSWSLTAGAAEGAAALDDLELAQRAGEGALAAHLAAPGAAAGAAAALAGALGRLGGRRELLRACWLLCLLVTRAPAPAAVAAGLAAAPAGLDPLVAIAVRRLADRELGELARAAASVVLGWRRLEEAPARWAEGPTREIVDALITDVALTGSVQALDCLGYLLRRDRARVVFCERDGLSTLGEVLSKGGRSGERVRTLYKAVFATWMASYATSSPAVETVLKAALAARIIMILVSLLDDSAGKRLKVARVILATLKNFAVGNSSPALRTSLRREMVGVGARKMLMDLTRTAAAFGSLRDWDREVAADVECLFEVLAKEENEMTTFDKYLGEVRSGALRWSSMHLDESFFVTNMEEIGPKARELVLKLAEYISGNASVPDEARAIACSDLSFIVRISPVARSIALSLPNVKSDIMALMTSAADPQVRQKALVCAQALLTRRH